MADSTAAPNCRSARPTRSPRAIRAVDWKSQTTASSRISRQIPLMRTRLPSCAWHSGPGNKKLVITSQHFVRRTSLTERPADPHPPVVVPAGRKRKWWLRDSPLLSLAELPNWVGRSGRFHHANDKTSPTYSVDGRMRVRRVSTSCALFAEEYQHAASDARRHRSARATILAV